MGTWSAFDIAGAALFLVGLVLCTIGGFIDFRTNYAAWNRVMSSPSRRDFLKQAREGSGRFFRHPWSRTLAFTGAALALAGMCVPAVGSWLHS